MEKHCRYLLAVLAVLGCHLCCRILQSMREQSKGFEFTTWAPIVYSSLLKASPIRTPRCQSCIANACERSCCTSFDNILSLHTRKKYWSSLSISKVLAQVYELLRFQPDNMQLALLPIEEVFAHFASNNCRAFCIHSTLCFA